MSNQLCMQGLRRQNDFVNLATYCVQSHNCSSVINWLFLMYKSQWFRLFCSQRGTQFGELMFSLSYLPTAERLTVVIVKARNLKFPQNRESGDPFVKVSYSYVCCNIWTAEREYRPSVTTIFISVYSLLHVSTFVKSDHQAMQNM
jgi:hypothetical protein